MRPVFSTHKYKPQQIMTIASDSRDLRLYHFDLTQLSIKS